MTILVTGAAGFIGSHLAERLLRRGDTVIGLDNFNDYYDPARKRANEQRLCAYPNFRMVEADVRDRQHMLALLAANDVRAVAHLAAMAGVRNAIEQPDLYVNVNLNGTQNLLDAVIGLPANLFTTTGIPVAILIFDRSREQGGANEDRRDVLFIDASKEFTPGKTQNVMDEAHIARVLGTCAARVETPKYSRRASPEEIAENDFNLNIPRYVDTFEPEEEIDVAALQKQINTIEAELAEVRGKMAGYLKELGVDV